MGNPLRIKTLVSAVSLAMVGMVFQPTGDALAAAAPKTAAAHAEGVQSYFINFGEAGLVNYRGGVQGFAPTAPSAAHTRKLDVHSPAAVAYANYLQAARIGYINAIQSALGHQIPVTHQYAVTHNGIAANLSASEAAAVARVPGVASVKLAGFERIVTYRGPKFIGAGSIWDGSATPDGIGTLGEGTVIAVPDSGANSTHPSFANDPACGFSPSNPKLLSAVDCSATDGMGYCAGTNPEANPGNGHGVHTASTAGGNTLDNTASPAPNLPDGVTMSGVAPCAQIRSYKVCPADTCPGADIAAGLNSAIADGADALNFSISGGTSPWNDNDRTFLDAVYADIFVAAAAGNTREGDTTPVGKVNHRGPWLMTVAASTHDQALGPTMSVVGPGTPPPEVEAIPLNPGSSTPVSATPTWSGKPVKSYPSNIEGCTASGGIAAGTFTGSIAVIRRGTCTFVEKITNAYNAGAEMVVIGNNQPGSINMNTDGAPSVPAYSINSVDTGDALLDFLADNPADATADVSALGEAAIQGDVLADFSYRGPTPGALVNVTKPDIAAPGVDIYAAVTASEGNYNYYSGTSMATPHVAGAAALVRAVQPGWSVTEVKSAMQSTAKNPGFEEDASTPWHVDDVGNGRVELTRAALAGFTLDETKANYIAANPSGGSLDVRQLNLPSLRNMTCDESCTFTRRLTNKLSTQATWNTSFQSSVGSLGGSVSPSTITIAPGATQEIEITVWPQGGVGVMNYGYLTFSEANGQSPDQFFTIAVKGNPPPVVDLIFADGFDAGGGGTVDFYDNFDSYAAGSNVAGQGGWKGWGNDDAAGATVDDSNSGRTAPNSIRVEAASDLIHEFSYNSGVWTISAQQFIPSSFSGQTYYIFENVYSDTDISVVSWSTQIQFDSATGMLSNESGGANPFSAPFVTDRWVELKLVVDLDTDLQTFYYDGVQMFSGSWTQQYPDQSVPGILAIGSIDLFANGASPIWYDDIQITGSP